VVHRVGKQAVVPKGHRRGPNRSVAYLNLGDA
jgi:hypothetical protein